MKNFICLIKSITDKGNREDKIFCTVYANNLLEAKNKIINHYTKVNSYWDLDIIFISEQAGNLLKIE